MATPKKETVKAQPIFDIAVAEPKSIIQISEFEKKQKELVKKHPFIEITDSKTFKAAKENRTALQKGRTGLESQDKSLASVLAKLRKKVGESISSLVDITKPHEDKQQQEIDRYQKVLDDAKDEEERLEKEALDLFNEQISKVTAEFDELIEKADFESLEELQAEFINIVLKSRNFDYGLREFMFEELVEEKRNAFNKRQEALIKDEENRIANLEKEQEAKINEMFREGTELIDSADFENKDFLLNRLQVLNVNKFFDFDLGKNKENANKMFLALETKAKAKVTELQEKLIQNEKNANIELRESLLDFIFQMDLESREEYETRITEALGQDLSKLTPEAKEDFQKQAEKVKKELQRKQVELDKEQKAFDLERKERFEKLEANEWTKNTTELFGVITPLNFDPMKLTQEEFDSLISKIKRNRKRFIELDKIGVIVNLVKSNVVYYDETVAATLFVISNAEDSDFRLLLEKFKTTIEEKKKADKEFQERQELLKPEKEKIISWLNSFHTLSETEDDEVNILISSIQSELEIWVQEKIEEVNKL